MRKTLVIIGFMLLIGIVAVVASWHSSPPPNKPVLAEKKVVSAVTPGPVDIPAAQPEQEAKRLQAEVEHRFETLTLREQRAGTTIERGQPLVVNLQNILPVKSTKK